MPSQPVRPSTRITELTLWPKIVATAMARMMYGIARKMSVNRMIRLSVRPPANPAMAPRTRPMTSAIPVAMKPTRSEIRAP